MAVSDLTTELLKESYKAPHGTDTEKQMHEVILIALADQYSTCRDLAVTALPVLLRKSTSEQNKLTLKNLCWKIAPGKATFGPHVDNEERNRHKENAIIALKTITGEAYAYSREVSKDLCSILIPFFDLVLKDENKASLHEDVTEIVQILCETKSEFVNSKDVASLLKTTTAKIQNAGNTLTNRKRCSGILASLSRNVNMKQLTELVKVTSARCEKALKESSIVDCELGAYTLGMIAAKDEKSKRLLAETGGKKKKQSLASATVIPMLLKLCCALVDKMENSQDSGSEAFEPIAEQSLMALETILSRYAELNHSREMQFEEVLKTAMKLLNYDPNYDDDDDEGDTPADAMETCQIRTPDHDMKDAADEDDEVDEFADAYEDDEDDYYSDEIEDDDSWKVRRASAKVIGVILCAASEGILERHHEVIFRKFFKRMKSDREDAVKFECYDSLTAAFTAFSKKCEPNVVRTLVGMVRDLAIVRAQQQCVGDESKAKKKSQAAIAAATKLSVASLKLLGTVARANRTTAFIEASEKARSRLADAISCAAMTTNPHDIGVLSERDSSSNLRLEAVAFAANILGVQSVDGLVASSEDAYSSESYIEFTKNDIDKLTEAVFSCTKDPYYKLAAEGLLACACLVRRSRPDTSIAVTNKAEYTALASNSLDCAISRLSRPDEDQEVKDTSVMLLGDVLTHLGDTLTPAQQLNALALLIERMQSESTRLVATRSMAKVAKQSPSKVDLSGVAGDAICEFSSFLRKNDRNLREASLKGFKALVERSDEKTLKDVDCTKFVEEAVTAFRGFVVNDAYLSTMCLNAFAAVCERCVKLKKAAKKASEIGEGGPMKDALQFVSSSLIQRQALLALERYFEAAVIASKETFDVIFEELSSISVPSPHDMETDDHQVVRIQQQDIASARLEMKNRASCIATATLAAGDVVAKKTIASLSKEISKNDGKREVISLWTLGEIGKRSKLDDGNNIAGILWEKLEEDCSDEVKTAVAFALGSCAFGNKDAFFPKILDTIKATNGVKESLKHSALRALREVIVCTDGSSSNEDTLSGSQMSVPAYSASPRKKKAKREDDDVLFKSTQQAWSIVLSKARDENLEDDAVKADIAEVLGRFVARNHALVKEIQEGLTSILKGEKTPANAKKAALLVDSVRIALVSLPKDEHFKSSLESFVQLVGDSDHNCRRAATQLLSVIARRNSAQNDDLSSLLPTVLPDILAQLKVNEALIKEIDFGPFKQKIDSGLELRTASYDFIDILLTQPKSSLGFAITDDDVEMIIENLIVGLKDPESSIKISTHESFERLCGDSVANGGSYVLKHAEKICADMLETMWTEIPEKALKHEREAIEELIKSTLKVVKAMEDIPDAAECSKLVETKKEIVEDELLSKFWMSLFGEKPHELELVA